MDTVSTRTPIVRAAGEGEQRWSYGGGLHTWKATTEETGGAFLLFEARMKRGKITPLHTHPSDETMYVLEGEILVHMDGTEHRVGTGGVVVRNGRRRPHRGVGGPQQRHRDRRAAAVHPNERASLNRTTELIL